MLERARQVSRCSSSVIADETAKKLWDGGCGEGLSSPVDRSRGWSLPGPGKRETRGTEFLFLLAAVSFDVVFGGFGGVVRRVGLMSLSYVRVMGCCFVVAFLVVTGSFAMVVGRFVMVLGSLGMMVRRFLRHSGFPFAWIVPDYGTASSTNIVRRR